MKGDPKPRYAPNALSYSCRGKEAVSTMTCLVVCVYMAHFASVTSSLGESERQKLKTCAVKRSKSGGSRLTLATLSSLCAGSFGSEIDTRSRGTAHASLGGLLDGELLCDGGEEFLDILGRLCRGLEEEQTGFLGVLFGIGGRDGALVGFFGDEIELVSGESNDDVLVGLTLQLLDPSLCLVEGSLCGLC